MSEGQSITDFVKAGFAGVHQGADDALAKLDALVPELAELPPEQIALAIAGLAQATINKKKGATAVAIVKQVLPVVVGML